MTASWTDAPARLRHRVNQSIRSAVGLTHEPPPRCDDPDEAYFPIDGAARIIHGDLASMLVGGLGSLFFQMLHPYSMAGVAQHSRYQHDPLGRLLQTANFIGFTTYGSSANAYASIERVLAVHQSVRGVADDGVEYYANDPHLLAWVHAAEMSMFLEGYRRFGRLRLTNDEADAYVNEMAHLARDMGVDDAPTTVDELTATLLRFRPELRLTTDAVTAQVAGRAPLATGRRDVRGWARSASRSTTSLTRYVEDEARQNATNATTVSMSTGTRVSSPAASGTANTRTFLTH